MQKNPANRFSDVRQLIAAIGMDLDQRYMIVDRQSGAAPLEPVVSTGQPPVIEPIPLSYATPQNDPPKYARSPVSEETQARLRNEEPIARLVRVNWRRMTDAWNSNQMAPGARAAVIAVIVIMSILNLGPIIAVAVGLGTIYLPYYIVWAIVMGGTKDPIDQETLCRAHRSPQSKRTTQAIAASHPTRGGQAWPAIRTPVPKPLSIKQWKVAKRRQLALAKPSMIGAELTGSWIGSAIVITVFTALVAIFQIGQIGHTQIDQGKIVGLVWAAAMSFICAAVTITLGKRWQTTEGDSSIRAFVQLTLGLAIGAVGYVLSEFLTVPWSGIAYENFGDLPVQRWKGFFNPDKSPMFPAYLAYFPLMMGMVHWWKQADPLRRTRFSLFSVLWVLLMAGLIQLLIPFPQPWGALVFAGTSIAVQLATPWYSSDERLELTHQQVA